MTHLEEILQSHDLRRDPGESDFDRFKQRAHQNPVNRCMHHHVFDTSLAAQLVEHMKLQILTIQVHRPFDICILARKVDHISQEQVQKHKALVAESCKRSPFKTDHAKQRNDV
jgi:hypothetical protein